ncbi:hypothetical protein B0T26DRAFT_680906 [Lasiosphaeria miniovina]|uniref:Uncharacterized protein n=1 Tax=Lasiosphaeria miniovina TaxID=1954250 RepID=A0AA39ZTD4_9PEZI|nr:uncharacterized protein B0T26DRAFT_680906 [Lasiosphaeria miniovina]KAK0703178.1 hypothetical protein B0T26DRAFT_680906 [Lasiosphaeria miniovina]
MTPTPTTLRETQSSSPCAVLAQRGTPAKRLLSFLLLAPRHGRRLDSCISRVLVVSGPLAVVNRAAIEAVVGAVSVFTLQDMIVADNSPANRTLVFQFRSFHVV